MDYNPNIKFDSGRFAGVKLAQAPRSYIEKMALGKKQPWKTYCLKELERRGIPVNTNVVIAMHAIDRLTRPGPFIKEYAHRGIVGLPTALVRAVQKIDQIGTGTTTHIVEIAKCKIKLVINSIQTEKGVQFEIITAYYTGKIL